MCVQVGRRLQGGGLAVEVGPPAGEQELVHGQAQGGGPLHAGPHPAGGLVDGGGRALPVEHPHQPRLPPRLGVDVVVDLDPPPVAVLAPGGAAGEELAPGGRPRPVAVVLQAGQVALVHVVRRQRPQAVGPGGDGAHRQQEHQHRGPGAGGQGQAALRGEGGQGHPRGQGQAEGEGPVEAPGELHQGQQRGHVPHRPRPGGVEEPAAQGQDAEQQGQAGEVGLTPAPEQGQGHGQRGQPEQELPQADLLRGEAPHGVVVEDEGEVGRPGPGVAVLRPGHPGPPADGVVEPVLGVVEPALGQAQLYGARLLDGGEPEEGGQADPQSHRPGGAGGPRAGGAPLDEGHGEEPHREQAQADQGRDVVGQQQHRGQGGEGPCPGRCPRPSGAVERLPAGQEQPGQEPQPQGLRHGGADVEVGQEGVRREAVDHPRYQGGVAPPGEGPGEGVGPGGAQGGAQHPRPLQGGVDRQPGPVQGRPQVVQPGGVVVEQGVAVAQVEVAQPARVGLPPPQGGPHGEDPHQVVGGVRDVVPEQVRAHPGPGHEGQGDPQHRRAQGRPGQPRGEGRAGHQPALPGPRRCRHLGAGGGVRRGSGDGEGGRRQVPPVAVTGCRLRAPGRREPWPRHC